MGATKEAAKFVGMLAVGAAAAPVIGAFACAMALFDLDRDTSGSRPSIPKNPDLPKPQSAGGSRSDQPQPDAGS